MWTCSGPGGVLSAVHISRHLSSQLPPEIVAITFPILHMGKPRHKEVKVPQLGNLAVNRPFFKPLC